MDLINSTFSEMMRLNVTIVIELKEFKLIAIARKCSIVQNNAKLKISLIMTMYASLSQLMARNSDHVADMIGLFSSELFIIQFNIYVMLIYIRQY